MKARPRLYWTYERCKEEVSKLTYIKDLQGTTIWAVMKREGWFDELTSNLIRTSRKPYTKEEILECALKCKTRGEFQKKFTYQYSSARRKGILDEVCQHMLKSRSEKQYTKEEILISAKKYTNQRDWLNTEPSIFRCANGYNTLKQTKENKDFWKECISHMEYIFKPNGYWTYERCKEVSKKFVSIKEFRLSEDYRSVYSIIVKNKWLDLLENMEPGRKPNHYWTYEKCKEAALKFNSRSEFVKSEDYSMGYHTITKKGWFELLSHMKVMMTLKQRVIYSYEFKESRMVYVGLTCDINRRHNAHLGKETRYGEATSPVFKYSELTKETPKFKILSKKPIKEENAPKSEQYYIEKYKNDGWGLLNKARAGSLGGNRRVWTKEKMKTVCDSCTKVSELRKKIPLWAVYLIKRNGWWDELTSHMFMDVRKEWTDKEVLEIAHQFDSISLLQKKYHGVSKYIRKRPELRKELDKYWLKRMEVIKIGNQPTKEVCRLTALKYRLKTDFRDKDRRIFNFSKEMGWLDEICGHMTRVYWTYERCKEEVLKYKTKEELQKSSKGCYNSVYSNRWFDLLSHMVRGHRKSMWNYHTCKEESKKYNYRFEYKKASKTSYEVSRQNGWLDEFIPNKRINQFK